MVHWELEAREVYIEGLEIGGVTRWRLRGSHQKSKRECVGHVARDLGARREIGEEVK